MTGITVMLVDDDAFTRVMFATTMQSLGHSVVGVFATVSEAAKFAATANPQLAIVDLDLGPGPTGIDLAQNLRRAHRAIGIILLTSYDDPRLIRAKNLTLPEGTVYLSKKQVDNLSIIEMAIATAMLHATLEVISPAQKTDSAGAKTLKISDSQIEVMRLVSTGLTNAEIAKKRFSSEAAVGKAIARLVRQLGIVATAEQNQRVLIARAYFEAIGRATRNDV